MGKIITYNNPLTDKPNQCYCQIKFESGERILISQARDGIKIFKLLLGIIPISSIFSIGFFDTRHDKFMSDDVTSSLLIDHYINKILPMTSISELRKFISNLDN